MSLHAPSRNVPILPPAATAAAARAALAAPDLDSHERVWVVDGAALVGVVPLPRLLTAAPETPLRDLADPPPAAVEADTGAERVALHALRQRLDAVPVARDGAFLGVVPSHALLEVLRREHVEDLHRLAGIQREQDSTVRALEEPATRNALHRLPWLVVGLFGTLVAGGVMTGFEETLRADVAVAFFVPGIVYLADAVGTQTETLVIRGLARSHLPLWRVVLREMGTGALLGAVLGALALPAVWLGWGDARLAAAVALSVAVACATATTVGMLLPWALSARGVDPAYGSGPLATIVQDVLSLVVYLVVVRSIL